MSYIKEVFEPISLGHAKHIVLTSDPKNPNKFEEETKYFLQQIDGFSIIDSTKTVLDFGCGMGRVSKEIVNNYGCNVIGVDNNLRMRQFSLLYVNNPQKYQTFESYTEKNTIDVVISNFVLQHVEDPQKEIDNLIDVMKVGGHLVVVNENKRFVPTDVDRDNYIIWTDDGFDIFEELSKRLTLIKKVPYLNTAISINLYKKD